MECLFIALLKIEFLKCDESNTTAKKSYLNVSYQTFPKQSYQMPPFVEFYTILLEINTE